MRLYIFHFATVSLVFGLILAAPHAASHADSHKDFSGFNPTNLEDYDPSALIPILDEPHQEIQGSVEDSFYGIIHYDIYERAFKIEDFFPLGYNAIVEYEYYPRLYERERDGIKGWEPVVSKESGSFMRGSKVIASYIKMFNENGEQESYSRKGFSVVVPIMKAIAAILGLDFKSEDI